LRGRTTDAVRILIADDDSIVRLTTRGLVAREPRLELVGEARDALEAVELALSLRPDVVLCDVEMPGGGGPHATREIRRQLPGTQVVVLTADDTDAVREEMLAAGAVGFLPKAAGEELLVRTLLDAAGR
jgi:DNA-binding NarL/FixJ family response regulator